MSRTVITIIALAFFSITARAQRDIRVNIYNDGFSQVTEKRTVELKKGQDQIELYDVAEKIDPGSITVSGNGIDIKWIDYRYDFVSAERLLYKFLGREISFHKNDSLISGILVRYDSKYLFLAPSGWPGPVSIYEREDLKNIDLPELPEGLVSKPTIAVGTGENVSGTREIILSYLTTGLEWKAEYRLAYVEGKGAELSGWISLNNQSGLSFPNAEIFLVAGKVDRAEPTAGSSAQAETGTSGSTSESPMVPLVDYHRYGLPFRVDISEMESKQAVLFSPRNIDVDHFYRYKWSETKSDVKSVVEFENDSKSGLGMALPPGRISIYDSRTGAFLGSGDFDGAPAGEKAEIVMGSAFDIKAERKRTEHKKLGRNKNSDSFEIEIRNHKSEDIELVVTEELYGYWEIVEKSDDYTKKDFQTMEFRVKVPKGQSKKITYSVEYSY